MSQRLKLTDSIVLNADEIVALSLNGTSSVLVYTTGTDFDDLGNGQNYFQLAAGVGEGPAVKAAIEKALISAPSGIVIEVPASSDYAITGFTFNTEF